SVTSNALQSVRYEVGEIVVDEPLVVDQLRAMAGDTQDELAKTHAGTLEREAQLDDSSGAVTVLRNRLGCASQNQVESGEAQLGRGAVQMGSQFIGAVKIAPISPLGLQPLQSLPGAFSGGADGPQSFKQV